MSTINRIFLLLEDGKPRSVRQIARELEMDPGPVSDAVLRQWNKRTIARTKKRISEIDYQHKGRAGRSRNVRHYYLYCLPEDMDYRFHLKPEEEDQEPSINKAQKVREFIRENKDEAFFSREIADALAEFGVKITDVMPTLRKMEEKRDCYIRGYSDLEFERPFQEGFLSTFLDSEKPPRTAIKEAFNRTEKKLQDRASSNEFLQRLHRIHDAIVTNSQRREITAKFFLDNLLDCSPYQLNHAIDRCLQLYPHFRKVKIFNRFVFFYDSSILDKKELQAQIALKKNWLRKVAGRWNRLGHNWEAVAGWFVDQFTSGVTFWSQDHRKRAPLDPLLPKRGMHPRRITLHLLKPVGDRKHFAEVDRVWEVKSTAFAKTPTIYVMEAKWSLVRKRVLDDFFEVLRWSKEFGSDSTRGRVIKSGVVPIFAASSFAKETIKIGKESLSVAQYAGRLNIELWTQAKFNEMLYERSIPMNITVQKVCRVAADEDEVAEILDTIWKTPKKAESILREYSIKNKELLDFEDEIKKKRKNKR
ncbi:MAG: hypothetical protein GF308_11745 [Candidatus Heimdallarchaeota archaeon]|nr:hypothetical protein [Candidatus Heimdallarchaeota archaeon]